MVCVNGKWYWGALGMPAWDVLDVIRGWDRPSLLGDQVWILVRNPHCGGSVWLQRLLECNSVHVCVCVLTSAAVIR